MQQLDGILANATLQSGLYKTRIFNITTQRYTGKYKVLDLKMDDENGRFWFLFLQGDFFFHPAKLVLKLVFFAKKFSFVFMCEQKVKE